MGRTSKSKVAEEELRDIAPAMTPESRQEQLIALAVNNAEKRLLDGTASDRIICHYLKLDSDRRKSEKELVMMDKQMGLIDAKTKAAQSNDELKQLMTDAIAAMKIYSGADDD